MTKLFRCEYCEANDKVLFPYDVIQRRVSPDLPLDIQKSEINIPHTLFRENQTLASPPQTGLVRKFGIFQIPPTTLLRKSQILAQPATVIENTNLGLIPPHLVRKFYILWFKRLPLFL